jgi:hypothetical protein
MPRVRISIDTLNSLVRGCLKNKQGRSMSFWGSALLAVHTLVPPIDAAPPLNLKFLHRQARGLLFKPSPGCFPSCTLQSAGASSLAGQAECDERASSQRSYCYEIMLATTRYRCCIKCAYEETWPSGRWLSAGVSEINLRNPALNHAIRRSFHSPLHLTTWPSGT